MLIISRLYFSEKYQTEDITKVTTVLSIWYLPSYLLAVYDSK